MLVAGAVALLAAAVYLPALNNDFVYWDDQVYVYDQPHIAQSGWPLVRWAFTTFTNATWHPLTWLSFALDHRVWGANPFGYHLTNVVLYAVTAGLTVLLAGLWFARRGRVGGGAMLVGAGLVGALFAVHPLHVESVAWVSGRKDLLYGLFWLLSLLAYTAYADAASAAARTRAYLLSLGCFALALLSKPMAVTLPAVLLLLDWYPFARLRRGTVLRVVVWEKLPFAVLSLGVCVLTVVAIRVTPTSFDVEAVPLADRLRTAAWGPGYYLAKTVVPVHLVPFYPRSPQAAALSGAHLASYAALIAVSVGAARWRARAPLVAAAWVFLLVTLLPVLGIARIGLHVVADRYMYLPLLGPLALVGAGAAYAWQQFGQVRGALTGAAVLLTAWYAAATVDQIHVWDDSVSLWEYVVDASPPHSVSLFNLGQVYQQRGELDKTLDAWRRATEAEPPFSPAFNQLGNLLLMGGDVEQAYTYYARAVEIDPRNYQAQYNLGLTLERLGRMDEACTHYREFRRLAPPEYAAQAAQAAAKCP